MLKIMSTTTIEELIAKGKELKQMKDHYTQQLKEVQQQLLEDPVMQQALHNEMNTVNDRGTSLTGTVEVYDSKGEQLLSVSSVGWKLGMSQPSALKYRNEHPEASVFLDLQVKPKTRELLKAAAMDEQLVEELGISYDTATPSVKYV